MITFNGVEIIINECIRILSLSVWNSVAMGLTAVVVAATALVFNHYNWRRARVLSLMVIVSFIGWYVVRELVVGRNAMWEVTAITETCVTVLMGTGMLSGFWIAGIIAALNPNPVVTIKLAIVGALRSAADRLENTTQKERIVKQVTKEQATLDYIQSVITRTSDPVTQQQQ